MNNIDALIEKYYSWLKDKTAWKNFKEWTEITVPYLDRNNDYIQIYLKKTNEGFLLTDDGDTVSGLKQEGCRLDSPKRRELLEATLRGYGVRERNGEIQTTVNSIDDFPLAKHSLVQAILSVNDMFYTVTSNVMNLFFEDIKKWLEDSRVRYSERVSFKGLSGYTRNFDFLIPQSSQQPERLIKSVNNPGKSIFDSLIMDWEDTKSARPPTAKMYAFINDAKINQSGRKPQETFIQENGKGPVENKFDNEQQLHAVAKAVSAFKQYNIHATPWSEKDKVKDELAA